MKRSILETGILSFTECRDWFREKITFREGGTFPDIMFVYQNSLVIMLSLSLRGRIDRKLQSETARFVFFRRIALIGLLCKPAKGLRQREGGGKEREKTRTRTRKLCFTRIIV